jgi:YHS domain-containing protein
MKKKAFLSLIALMAITLISFVNLSEANAQNDCCSKTTSASCCETNSAACCEKTNGTSQGTETMSPDSAVCMVSGEPMESGKGVGFTYLGKEYKFCCAGCIEEFKTEPMNYLKDEIQCPVMGSAAKKDVSTVVDGVKYYFCCAGCDDKFKESPEKYMNGNVEKEGKHEGHH